MAMEYLTLVIDVLIPLTQDALKKLHSSSLWRQVKCATDEPTCYYSLLDMSL